MSELEDKLNHLLDDPAAMGRIFEMAQQLSSTLSPTGDAPPQNTPPPTGGLGELGLDAMTIAKLLPLVQELRTNNTQTSQLLIALRPYLKEEKQTKVERAIKLAHLIHVGKKAVKEWGTEFV